LEDILGEELVASLDKARDHVKFFNKSTQALEKLKKHQKAKKKPLGVVKDVVTQWWSTLDMIEPLLVIKSVIAFMQSGGDLKDVPEMNGKDWDNIYQISLVLMPFKEA
jgi:hypothetical protein